MKINGLFRLSILPAVVFFIVGCGNPNRKGHTVNDHRKIYGNVLALPEGGKWMTCEGRDTLVALQPGIPRIVINYSAEGCTSCRLRELGSWNSALRRLEEAADSVGAELIPVFILEADPYDPEIAGTLLRQNLRYPVMFDTEGKFRANNTLPANELYHTFLTDSRGRICMAGSPIFNPALLNAYGETLKRLALQ